MTIFRFSHRRRDWKLLLAFGCLYIGWFGFMICWIVGWNAERRILGHHEFEQRSAERPLAVDMKGQTFFVEPAYGKRYNFATGIISYIWAVGASGMIYLNRRKIQDELE